MTEVPGLPPFRKLKKEMNKLFNNIEYKGYEANEFKHWVLAFWGLLLSWRFFFTD